MSVNLDPAVDLFISEIPTENPPRFIRLFGLIVTVGSTSFVLNDGEKQLEIDFGRVSSAEFSPNLPIRLFVEIVEKGEGFRYQCFAAHKLSVDELDRYKKLVLLERRLVKKE